MIEKEKAYDKAIKKAKKLYNNGITEEIFPELKEDNDEKIKEAILNGLIDCRDAPDLGWSNFGGIHINDCIAWLKKQGEQKKQVHFPKFTFDDVLALQCCMETVKKVQEDKELYKQLNLIHSKIYDAYQFEKQNEQASLQNNENIDLIKILKDCPKGEIFWSPVFGDIKFHDINQKRNFINIVLENRETWNINADGTISFGDVTSPEIMLYPSHEQRDWSKFTAPWYKKDNLVNPKFKVGDWIISSVLGIAHIICVNDDFNEYQLEYIDGKQKFSSIDYVNYEYNKWTINDAKDGDVLSLSWLEDKNLFEKIIIFKKYHSEGVKGSYSMPCVEGYSKTFKNGKMAFPDEEVSYYSKTWTCNLYPATKEQRNLLFQKIKEAGYKWNDETKTLEKLIKPKFKVGDKIVNVPMKYMGGSWTQGTISKITDNKYIFTDSSYISISSQDSWELVYDKKPKFDPKTLNPFDKVITRCDHTYTWSCDFFSHVYSKLLFICLGGQYKQCIPYNDETKHLIGTTEEAPKYYRYWED